MKCDLTNQRFGKLLVLEPTDQRKHGCILWKCRCDCGKELLLDSRKLKNGVVNSCGCAESIPKDITGHRFGKLVVMGKTGKRSQNRYILWRCKCDCGQEIETTRNKLLSGNISSCGCGKTPELKQWEGKWFGNLVVTAYCKKEKGSHFWTCQCDCGKTVNVRQSNLQNGSTTSCGCRHDPKSSMHFVEGTCLERIQSKKISRANTSGIRGVYFNQKRGKWVAQIMFQKKCYYLGSFEKLEDATKARAVGEEMFETFIEQYHQNADNMKLPNYR